MNEPDAGPPPAAPPRKPKAHETLPVCDRVGCDKPASYLAKFSSGREALVCRTCRRLNQEYIVDTRPLFFYKDTFVRREERKSLKRAVAKLQAKVAASVAARKAEGGQS